MATAGSSQVSLSWTGPALDGGPPVTGYNVYQGTSPASVDQYPATTPVTSSLVNSATVTGLTNGTTYYFEVTAVSYDSESLPSNEVSATPVAASNLPGAPTGLMATAGSSQVSLSWTGPASDGGPLVTGYHVYQGITPGGESFNAPVTTATGTSATVTGLTNGTTYYFVVRAVNATGEGPSSNEVSATPVAASNLPGAPTGLMATAGSSQVSLSWTGPASDGGPLVTGYHVYQGITPGGESFNAPVTTATGTSATVTGLTNGTTYYFVVRAVNATGEGPSSNEVSATPVAASNLPGAPTGLMATAGSSQVSLSWTGPASDGGPLVTGYHIYQGITPGGESFNAPVTTATGTSATVTGLTNGTTYYFVVRAVNATGEGPSSNEVSATPVAATQRPPSRGWPLLIILLGAVILAAAAVAAIVGVRRLRRPPPPPAPAASVQAVSQADQASVASVHVTGAEPTVTVRIEPQPGAGITTIEETRP